MNLHECLEAGMKQALEDLGSAAAGKLVSQIARRLRASPHISPSRYCDGVSPHSDARFRGPAPRRTYRYASGAEPRNLTSEHESALLALLSQSSRHTTW